jgi:DNA-binding NarL/FixJ family response regulator/class 3 adenylate cyclase
LRGSIQANQGRANSEHRSRTGVVAESPGGAQSAAGAIKTFLVADVRGYTRFTEQHGDEAAGALTIRFSEITTDVIEAAGGVVVEFRGDEALAAFDSARAAIGAAVALQRRFAEATFSDESLPLPIGIGLDAGEAVPIADGYRGASLNLAARLCALAGAGEILASHEVIHLAGKVAGVTYEERGPVRVKNLTQPVRVVRVVPVEDDPAQRFAALGFAAATATVPRKLRLAIAEDSVLIREVLVRVLSEAGCEIVTQAQDAEGLLAAVREDPPDVVVTDIRMPPTHTNEGLMAALSIRSEFPEVAVLVLSQYVETHHAMELIGESPERVGYLLKDRISNVSELADAVRRVASGEVVIDPQVIGRLLRRRRDPLEALTEEERTILGLMAEGLSNQAITERSSLAEEFVEARIADIFRKLGLETEAGEHSRVQAVLAYLRA